MQRPAVSRHLSALLPALVLLVFGYRQRWIGDDGFINLRVVEQLVSGHGFVFNIGERVEAVTSPLWIFVLSAFAGLGLPSDDCAVALGLVLSTVGLALIGYAIATSYGLRAPIERVGFVPFGALAYACIPAAWDYVTSALENSLGLFWLGCSAWLTTRALERTEARAAFLGAWVIGLAPIVRPDCALLGFPLGLLLLLHVSARRQQALVAVLGALPGALFQLFRMGYFAALVPNTAYAKEAFSSWWEQGLHYLWNTVGLYWLLVPFGCVITCFALTAREGLATGGRVRWALLLGGLLHVAYITRVGGDFMHARLLLPGLAAVCASLAVLPITATWALPQLTRVLSFVVLCGWALFCVSSLRVNPENEFGIGDERGWFARMAGIPNPTHIDDYTKFFFYTDALQQKMAIAGGCRNGAADLKAASGDACARVAVTTNYAEQLRDGRRVLPLAPDAAPQSVIAVAAAGPLGIPAGVLGSRVSLVDLHGLADPVAARLLLERRSRPGHEKHFAMWWFAARYAEKDASSDARVRDARDALACGPIDALTRAVREPLTVSRFFENMLLALELHDLRVPTDPARAKWELCKR